MLPSSSSSQLGSDEKPGDLPNPSTETLLEKISKLEKENEELKQRARQSSSTTPVNPQPTPRKLQPSTSRTAPPKKKSLISQRTRDLFYKGVGSGAIIALGVVMILGLLGPVGPAGWIIATIGVICMLHTLNQARKKPPVTLLPSQQSKTNSPQKGQDEATLRRNNSAKTLNETIEQNPSIREAINNRLTPQGKSKRLNFNNIPVTSPANNTSNPSSGSSSTSSTPVPIELDNKLNSAGTVLAPIPGSPLTNSSQTNSPSRSRKNTDQTDNNNQHSSTVSTDKRDSFSLSASAFSSFSIVSSSSSNGGTSPTKKHPVSVSLSQENNDDKGKTTENQSGFVTPTKKSPI